MFALPCTTFLELKYYQGQENALRHMSIDCVSVESITAKCVTTAKTNQSASAVANIMNHSNIGSVVITETENNRLICIITQRDIVQIVGTTEILMLQLLLARDIMSKPLILLSTMMLLVGGGLLPPMFGVVAGIISRRVT